MNMTLNNTSNYSLYNTDTISFMKNHLKENSVDLIVADPPYFEICGDDDFLAYPKFYRKVPSGIEINNWHKYLDYCMNNNKIQPNTDLATLQEIELKNMYDFYARVYVEQISSNLFDIYIIGYITKQNLIKDSVIKRMPQYGKSEQALYIATQIKNGIKFKK